MRLIVSLTTTPKRLAAIAPTLRSLVSQTRLPEQIWIHLPRTLARTGETYVLDPSLVAQFREFPIVWNWVDQDDGPGTKLTPTVRLFSPQSDLYFVTVDDDISYPENLLEQYENYLSKRGSACAVGLSGFVFRPPLLEWLKQEHTVPADVLEGYASVCYPSTIFDRDFDGYLKTCLANQVTRLSDDIYLSNWVALQGLERERFFSEKCNLPKMVAAGAVLDLGQGEDALHLGASKTVPSSLPRNFLSLMHLKREGLLAPSFAHALKSN